MAFETPPPYSIAASASTYGSIFGFPLGYFVIRSLATGRVLDVDANQISDGTEVVLWEEKEKSLVESMRDRGADNQLFFIDETGALCSKHSGHAIDISDGMLVLRHRRPITHPYPNRYSHELPRFSYDPVSGNISIAFTSDPSYPDPRFQVREPPPTPPEADDEGDSRSHLAATFQITNGSCSSIELSGPEREPTKAPSRARSNSSPFHGQAPLQDDRQPPIAIAALQPQPHRPPPPAPPPWRRRTNANESWKNRVYLLTSLPSRKPKTLLDDAAAFLSSTASILSSPIHSFPFPFSSGGAASPSSGGRNNNDNDNTNTRSLGGGGSSGGSGGRGGRGGSGQVVRLHIESGEYDLRENEIVEEERAEAEEVDDNPDPSRPVKVYGFRPRDLAEGAGNPRARERRRWEIVPIRKERRRF